MESGGVEWHRLFIATSRELDAFERAVAEGQLLNAALSYCSYLRNSCLLKLLKEHDNPGPHLIVNSALLEWKVKELEHAVRLRFKLGNMPVSLELSELQRIRHQLDLIAAQVGRVLPASEINVSAPPLRVIEGGAE